MTVAEAVQRLRRADLVEGLGIYVGPGSVALAHVRKRIFRVSLEGAEVMPLPPSDQGAARLDALASAVRAFVTDRGIDARRAALVLPRSAAMFSRVVLPAAAEENLAQVLEYELENLVPIPAEEVVYEFRSRRKDEDHLEVLLMCLPRAVLTQHLEALAAAGVRPRSVTVTSLALADWVAFASGTDETMGLVVGEGDSLEVALFEDGRVLTSQIIPSRVIAANGGLGDGVTRVLDDRGLAEEPPPLSAWQAGPGAAAVCGDCDGALAERGRGRIEASEEFFGDASGATLPAVGGALGVVRESALEVNLLPPDERRATEDRVSLATFALAGLVAVLFVVWGVSTMVKDELLQRTVTSEVSSFAPGIEKVRSLQDDIARLSGRLEVLDSGQDVRATDLVREITDLVPTEAYLTTLTFRRGRITMDGHAASASDVLTALEKSRRFKNVSFSSPTTRAGDKERFALSAEVAR